MRVLLNKACREEKRSSRVLHEQRGNRRVKYGQGGMKKCEQKSG
jgi:hypothetical protein